jgi:signal transduction histidine kinase/CheY-like chemotaxis protein
MVAITTLQILPWMWAAGWTLLLLVAAFGEDRLALVRRGEGRLARAARILCPSAAVLTTTLYAVAALVLIARGGRDERLFAFALIACSMLQVLMRHYRSPVLFMVNLTPYLAVLGLIGYGFARMAHGAGDWIGMVTSSFTLAIFGLLLWSGRAQLGATWMALLDAREAAEERERAAEAANQAKSNFLATMSHEIRTPLNGVLGMAQAMTAEELSGVQRERLKVIRRSSENLLAVLNDLLDLSKIEASALELEIVDFDLEHLIRGVTAAFQPGAQKKGVDFQFSVDPDVCGHYSGDSARIRRVLYNLAGNAVKFTDKGGIVLSVTREGGSVVFRVSDTGIGIAPDNLEHLFDDFYQADASSTRRYGGMGLGLAICRDLVGLMGGEIEAASILGQGSTFTVRLPLKAAFQAPEAPAPEARAAPETDPGDLRVLAAEDNETNQLVLRTLLEQAGVSPTFVNNGRRAVEAWEAQDWDIVLMDIQMPEMDGVTATRVIRAREAETGRRRTPILAVTANAMAHQVAGYEAAGMDGLVPKPIEITRLFAAMEEVLNAAEAQGPQEASLAKEA